MKERLNEFLGAAGFQPDPRYPQASAKLQAVFSKSGKSLGIFPYGDYIFIYEGVSDAAELAQLHAADRAYVNSLYSVPKALRLTVPNVITVVMATSPSPEMLEVVKGATRDVIGGEIHGVWIIDLAHEDLYMPSRTSYVLRLAGIPLSNVVANSVDPTNRANDTIASLFTRLVADKRGEAV